MDNLSLCQVLRDFFCVSYHFSGHVNEQVLRKGITILKSSVKNAPKICKAKYIEMLGKDSISLNTTPIEVCGHLFNYFLNMLDNTLEVQCVG